MDCIEKALELAMEAFHEEYGSDAKIEDGDEVVFVFKNCTLLLEIVEKELNIRFIGGSPLKIDYAVPVYKE